MFFDYEHEHEHRSTELEYAITSLVIPMESIRPPAGLDDFQLVNFILLIDIQVQPRRVRYVISPFFEPTLIIMSPSETVSRSGNNCTVSRHTMLDNPCLEMITDIQIWEE